jgi:hypothetical protein
LPFTWDAIYQTSRITDNWLLIYMQACLHIGSSQGRGLALQTMRYKIHPALLKASSEDRVVRRTGV